MTARFVIPFLTVCTAVCLLPFLDKAFHIDDPLFLWTARHIQIQPGNPYGFLVNWYGTPMPMAEVTKNPPLASYYIALVSSYVGWTERALHLAFLLPAVGVVLGTHALGRRMCTAPAVAGLITLLTPVFIVSSTTVMCDTLMLALFVFAVEAWRQGLDRSSPSLLLVSSMLVSLAALTKYFAMALVPLLFVYSVVRERRVGIRNIYLLVPVLVMGAYQWWTHLLYGRGLLMDAAAYATQMRPLGTQYGSKFMTGLAFTGGCLGSALLFTPRLWSARESMAGLLLIVTVAFVIFRATAFAGFPLAADFARHAGVSLQLGVFLVGGVGLLVLTLSDVVRTRDADSLLLALWVLGTLGFASVVNWTTNGRSVLPMVPAVAIMMVRRLDRHGTSQRIPCAPGVVISLLAAGVLALLVGWGDYRLAGAAREAASIMRDKHAGGAGTVWFEGHWGFQYYMEELGAKAIDVQTSRFHPGDIIVVPANNTNTFPLPTEWARAREVVEVPTGAWIGTMAPSLGAGFYADVWGPLPFAFGTVPPERYAIFDVSP